MVQSSCHTGGPSQSRDPALGHHRSHAAVTDRGGAIESKSADPLVLATHPCPGVGAGSCSAVGSAWVGSHYEVHDSHPTKYLQIPDGATLLIADDDRSVRRSLRRMLELERISVVEASDGEEAIRVIERDEAHLLDLVLIDLMMPVVSGSELIAVLMERRPGLAVVAMSAAADLPPGLFPVPLLRKPFEPEQLVRTVAPLVLSSHAMRRRDGRRARMPPSRVRWPNDRQTIASDQRGKCGDLMTALMHFAAAWRFSALCDPSQHGHEPE